MAHGLNTRSEVRRYVEVRTGEISDAVFNRLLRNLIRYGHLSRVGNTYAVLDPMIVRAVANTCID